MAAHLPPLNSFIRGPARALLYEALAGHLENGLTELDALRLLRQRTRKDDRRQAFLLDTAISRMEAGAPLSAALRGNVPDLEYMLLSAGDVNGRPQHTLARLAELVTLRDRVLSAVRGALAYPLFLLLLWALRSFTPGEGGEWTSAALVKAGNTQALGVELFTKYLLPFEIAGVILLVALIGGLILAVRDSGPARDDQTHQPVSPISQQNSGTEGP